MSESTEHTAYLVNFVNTHVLEIQKTWQGEDSDCELLCQAWKTCLVSETIRIDDLANNAGIETTRDKRVHDSYVARLNAFSRTYLQLEIDHRFDMTKLLSFELWLEIDKCAERLLHSSSARSGYGSPRDVEFYKNPDKEYPISEREAIIATLGYQLPWRENIETVKRICNGKRVLEVNAGSGLWGRLLLEAGVDVRCTDADPQPIAFTPITKLTWADACEIADQYDVLLTVWPPVKTDASLIELCKLFRTKDVVFIGEFGGCTGSNAFYKELKGWNLTEIAMPAHPCNYQWWIRQDSYPVPPSHIVPNVELLHWYPSRSKWGCPTRYTTS